jgi:hypothetical protein
VLAVLYAIGGVDLLLEGNVFFNAASRWICPQFRPLRLFSCIEMPFIVIPFEALRACPGTKKVRAAFLARSPSFC